MKVYVLTSGYWNELIVEGVYKYESTADAAAESKCEANVIEFELNEDAIASGGVYYEDDPLEYRKMLDLEVE